MRKSQIITLGKGGDSKERRLFQLQKKCYKSSNRANTIMEATMSLAFKTGYAPREKPEQFCMVSARKRDGTITKLESWTKHVGGRVTKNRRYNVLRLSPGQVEYWIQHWSFVSGHLKVPLIRLKYVLKNPEEFETGVAVCLPDEVREWTIEYSEHLTRQSKPNPTKQGRLGL